MKWNRKKRSSSKEHSERSKKKIARKTVLRFAREKKDKAAPRPSKQNSFEIPESAKAKAKSALRYMGKSHISESTKDGDSIQQNVSTAAYDTAAKGASSLADMAMRRRKGNKYKSKREVLRHDKAELNCKANAFYQRAVAKRPENARARSRIARAMQKRRIKREYAKAYRAHMAKAYKSKSAYAYKPTSPRIKKRVNDLLAKSVRLISKRPLRFIWALAIILALCLAFSSLTSLGGMAISGAAQIISTSYTSEDADIIAADNYYKGKESALRTQIKGIESAYPGYDEYRYDVGEVGHDPFSLASYLTAKYGTYTVGMVQADLDSLFMRQYSLTLSPSSVTKYRQETRIATRIVKDPITGKAKTETYTYTVNVPFAHKILNVTLTNSGIPAAMKLTKEQLEMYSVYMETKGNKPYLFEYDAYVDKNDGKYEDYDVAPEALTDARFAAMLKEAKKYLGYPYVWGGSSPSTSFDCSGYVSWVVNHSGWDIGRKTAQGLFDMCAKVKPAEAKPGDLIFFTGTYDSAGPVSHVGIYAGEKRMIHCGNPISFARIDTPYWTKHFYAYGRLPR